jgi:hypothetical protein
MSFFGERGLNVVIQVWIAISSAWIFESIRVSDVIFLNPRGSVIRYPVIIGEKLKVAWAEVAAGREEHGTRIQRATQPGSAVRITRKAWNQMILGNLRRM